jgi:hypothetical protein
MIEWLPFASFLVSVFAVWALDKADVDSGSDDNADAAAGSTSTVNC